MTPSTLVRNRRPFTFAAFTAMLLEAREEPKPVKLRPKHKCVALLDDGRPCDLPGRYLDFRRGGHVCFEHKPAARKEAMAL